MVTRQPEGQGLTQKRFRRVASLGSGIDLHRRAGAGTGGEDELGVEARLGPPPADELAAGAVPEDVGVGALDGGQHAARHGTAVHGQLGVDAGHDHVEAGQEILVLVETTVLEDVDLDAGEDAERRQFGVELGHDVELPAQALGVEPVGHGEPGTVVGEGPVVVAEVTGRLGHLPDGAAAVGPVRMAVAVAAQLCPESAPPPPPAPAPPAGEAR